MKQTPGCNDGASASLLPRLHLMEERVGERRDHPIVLADPPEAPFSPTGTLLSLTSAICAGDEAAFQTFYERYYDRLFRYLIVLTRGDENLTRDLLQITLAKIVRAFKPFADESRLWNWLAAVARNTFIDARRKAGRQLDLIQPFPDSQSIPEPVSLPPEPSPLLTLLDDCLGQLDADDHALIEASYFQQHTHQTMAAHHNTTPKAIESRLARIRQKLRQSRLNRLHHEDRS